MDQKNEFAPFLNVQALQMDDGDDLLIAQDLKIPFEDLYVIGDDNEGIEILNFFVKRAIYTPHPDSPICGYLNYGGITVFTTNNHGYINYYLAKSDLHHFLNI
jgi:hypothetical protein